MSKRILRVNQVIKEELSKILLKEIDLPKNCLTTITRLDTAPNLIQSKVYISTLPQDQIEIVLSFLQKRIYFLQQKLNRRLNMRPTPKIIFVKEKETEKAGRLEEVLQSLKKEGK